jgi:hypothetical protein
MREAAMRRSSAWVQWRLAGMSVRPFGDGRTLAGVTKSRQ